jgi:hypothetical protein
MWAILGVTALSVLVFVMALVSVGASASSNPGLKQECIEVALKKPQILRVGARHAGQYGGRTQSLFLNARYSAMPEACREDYYRLSEAKGQASRRGKWRFINDYYPLFGGKIVADPTPPVYGASEELNQVAYTGKYSSDPPLGHAPEHFDPCRVRILLKEALIDPAELEGNTPHALNYFASQVYVVNIPVAQISPHQGRACNLLVP